jgi:hypothetical protein
LLKLPDDKTKEIIDKLPKDIEMNERNDKQTEIIKKSDEENSQTEAGCNNNPETSYVYVPPIMINETQAEEGFTEIKLDKKE